VEGRHVIRYLTWNGKKTWGKRLVDVYQKVCYSCPKQKIDKFNMFANNSTSLFVR
jgi:hypothetical protein